MTKPKPRETCYFHYTAAHLAKVIGKYNATLIPQSQPLLGGVKLIWFTDMDGDYPDEDALGLTSILLPYSRTAVRYVSHAEPPDIVPWLTWRATKTLSPIWAGVESVGRPARWFVCDHSLVVSRDPFYRIDERIREAAVKG
jgi:hypothetical protein